jgi:pyridoxal phosphate enzyme (YggS family)
LHKTISNLISIVNELKSGSEQDLTAKIIAVTKTFPIGEIKPLINHGHLHFGENKVQEALEKWTELKNEVKDIKLHMIGKLQTNKVKFVIPLFDYIHSLDNLRLAQKISTEQKKLNKKLKIFIQVNIGNEDQKSGIKQNEVISFYEKCVNDFDLDIVGLMCIPPFKERKNGYFRLMNDLNKSIGLAELSMGMSSDYLEAVSHGATYIRIGSKIFGERS